MPRAATITRTVRAQPPTIRVSVPRAITPKPKAKRRSKSGGGSSRNLMGVAVGAAVFGFVEKSELGKSLPTVPVLGRKGSLALASYFLAKQTRSALAWDVCVAAVALSSYELASTGAISGEFSTAGHDDEDYG